MRNITVGLDFGTHQTKICIENAEISNQKTYEFFQFRDGISQTFFLPSIVQVNLDNTLSYGFVNDSKCKLRGITQSDLPIDIKFPPEKNVEDFPIKAEYPNPPSEPIYPPQPRISNYPEKPSLSTKSGNWKDQLRRIKNEMSNNASEHLIDWEIECKKIDAKNKRKMEQWDFDCYILRTKFELIYSDWQSACRLIDEDYQEVLDLFEKRMEEKEMIFNEKMSEFQFQLKMQDYLIRNESSFEVEFERLSFKNFKIASFSDDFEWAHTIAAEVVSVWYITNIIFLLKANLKSDFAIQMGVPRSIDRFFSKKQEQKALCILVASYKLHDKFDSHSSFLNAPYTDLIEKTEISDFFVEDDLNKYRLNVVPEAYAGLVALTRKNKLPKGMNLLVDIGGGSSDIAFFTIDNQIPDVYAVSSIHKGLNLLFGKIAALEDKWTIQEIQEKTRESDGFLGENLKEFNLLNSEIKSRVLMILGRVREAFKNSPGTHKLNIGMLKKALLNRPIVYSGGGANFRMLAVHIDKFTDIRKVTHDSFPFGSLIGVLPSEDLMSILCTSFGLSIPIENDINLKDINDLFAHLDDGIGTSSNSDNDYGLIDT